MAPSFSRIPGAGRRRFGKGKIKKEAIDFPQKAKAGISELDHWTDKQKQKPQLPILIRDTLWNKLLVPQKIYEYIYIRYPEIA